MNEPTYCVTGVAEMEGIGKNKIVSFPIYANNPPLVGNKFYARELDRIVLVIDVEKL